MPAPHWGAVAFAAVAPVKIYLSAHDNSGGAEKDACNEQQSESLPVGNRLQIEDLGYSDIPEPLEKPGKQKDKTDRERDKK